MRLALLSDIHSNLEGLTAVLAEIERLDVDEIYSLGDVVGYGCNPAECLNLVDKNCRVKLMGNHEHAVLGLVSTEGYTHGARVAATWTQERMTDREITIMSDFEMRFKKKGVLYLHASPVEPEEWHYILTPTEADEAFGNFNEPICFHGHTHIPVIFTEMDTGLPRRKAGHDFDPDPENRYLVNVGSVGQPRDNDPRACFVVFDTNEQHVEYHRVEYDISRVQAKMTEAELPRMLVNRLAAGR